MNQRIAKKLRKLALKFCLSDLNLRHNFTKRELYRSLKRSYKEVRAGRSVVKYLNPFPRLEFNRSKEEDKRP